MSTFRSFAFGAATLAAAFVMPAAASAAIATTTAHVNLRAGPGTHHRVIAVVPRGSQVQVHDCRGGWCRVSWGWQRGFLNNRYLAIRRGPPPSSRPPRPPHHHVWW